MCVTGGKVKLAKEMTYDPDRLLFSVISPYAYLAGDRLTTIAQRHDAEVIYKPLDVLALFARTGGTATSIVTAVAKNSACKN
jgi:2-hydroxychromene-2-carboxylate isomerase